MDISVKGYFDNIHEVITSHLDLACSEIRVAVAWFTDNALLQCLCRKAQGGVRVHVILIDDDINRGPNRLNFSLLENYGGKVHFISNQNYNKMHHKFCVIDRSIVITGSYNWTQQAKNNQENIIITEGERELANHFVDMFEQMMPPTGERPRVSMSPDAVKKRLELIQTLITLNDIEDIAVQVAKIEPAMAAYKLEAILDALKKPDYSLAAETIHLYLTRFTALTTSDDQEVVGLKIELKLLEFQSEAISNAKMDIDRDLMLFNRRHLEILGAVANEILQVKAEYARQLAARAHQQVEQISREELGQLEEDADQAEADYQEYFEHFREVKMSPVQVLNEAEAGELKKIYRQACHLCHPDRVAEEFKVQAQAVFIELREAYEQNDCEQVSKIFQRIKRGNFTHSETKVLNSYEALRTTVAEMRQRLEDIQDEFYQLQRDPAVQAMYAIGKSETAWIDYFKSKLPALEQERDDWITKLEQLNQPELSKQ